MITNVLEYIEKSANRFPDKIGFIGDDEELSFSSLCSRAKSIGTSLSKKGLDKIPVAVFMKKSPAELAAFMGVIYAGCYYIPLDGEMPEYRIELILNTAKPKVVIYDNTTREMVEKLNDSYEKLPYESIVDTVADDDILMQKRDNQLDTDPIYAVFTSGSTGVPKGVLACHRSVIDYIENISDVLGFDENSIVANQSPFYGDAYLKDFGPVVKNGARMVITPKQHFMFPMNLVSFLNEHKVNKISWTASALSLVSAVKTLDKTRPEYVTTVAFVGEVFPVKQLNAWKKALPEAKFINLYGPTEATGVSCYYEVNREFSLDEALPVGKPFKNTRIILLNDDGSETPKGEVGEICILGTCLTLGYFNNPEKTKECFIQNPLNTIYPERLYKTGDLGKYNVFGELEYVSRKDFQIKHMGQRIELGEIEVVVGAMEPIESICCIFDDENKKIVLYYVGEVQKAEVASYAKEKLPRYMFPNYIEKLEKMPYTTNGKIDRAGLKEKYKNK